MTEVVKEKFEVVTNVDRFRDFLAANSIEIVHEVDLQTQVQMDSRVEEKFTEALNFMQDVEIYHARWIDKVVADPDSLELKDLSKIKKDNTVWGARINIAMSELALGNLSLIQSISLQEQRHNRDSRVLNFKARDFMDGKFKWERFEGLAPQLDEFRKHTKPIQPEQFKKT